MSLLRWMSCLTSQESEMTTSASLRAMKGHGGLFLREFVVGIWRWSARQVFSVIVAKSECSLRRTESRGSLDAKEALADHCKQTSDSSRSYKSIQESLVLGHRTNHLNFLSPVVSLLRMSSGALQHPSECIVSIFRSQAATANTVSFID
ncbi:hypothetical protein E4T43_06909 [Aureobasidium subglaciale]|nr:hypothetical protein E4T43_06909 [Aureobasidium subglaciale]